MILQVKDGLLTQIDQDLPLTGHQADAVQCFYVVQYIAMGMSMGTQEVVVGNPQGKIIACAGDTVESVSGTVRSLVSAVEPFDQLLVGPEFGGNSVGIGKADHLGNLELHPVPELAEELLGSKRIGTVAVCDKPEAFGKVIAQFPESLPHGLYAGTDRPVHGSGIADDGAADGIHDEPDIGFDTADSDIGFISDEGAARAVVVVIDKGLDTDSCSPAVVCDLLA